MLRSGCTMEEILADATTRRVLGSLGAEAEKTLVAAGASVALIDALKSGRFGLNANRATQARAQIDQLAQREAADRQAAQTRVAQLSAHRCGPCRKFTPELVDWYRRNAAAHPEFELVFVNRDRSPADMTRYMQEAAMPWSALPLEVANKPPVELPRSRSSGIPCLLVVDSAGRVLLDSYASADNYLGPQKVLRDLDKMLMPAKTTASVR